jgi:dTDP-4-amino-4,6-dideoxygalactose transaminase
MNGESTMDNRTSARINVTRSSMPGFEEYCDEIRDLWDSRWLTNMGEKHRRLESGLQTYLDAAHLQLFTNGHLALEGILRAMELKGEVITTPFTFPSTVNAIVRCGLRPVFCDVKEDDCTIDASKIEKLITSDTCAILPVHVYGNICDHEVLENLARRYGLKLIYDAAHAFGVKCSGTPVAQMGDASMFSFHATKVFHTIEGGAVTFTDPALQGKLMQEKNFGYAGEDLQVTAGGNAKMNEFQAAMGLCNLRHVAENHEARKRVVEKYIAELSGVPGIRCWNPQPGYEPNYAYFPIFVDAEKFGANRDQLRDALAQENIYARRYFYPAVNEAVCYADVTGVPTPVAHRLSEQVLTLPLYTDLTDADVVRICRTLIAAGRYSR